MVTRAQIERLNARIEAVAAVLVPPDPIEYVVHLRFGESDEEFFAKYPDYPRDGRGVIHLKFGDGVSHGDESTA